MSTAESNLESQSSAQETLDAEDATRLRDSAAAQAREAALCCPVDYDRTLLEAIPDEVIERDYGCGDPSRYVREGETVLDLGSGGDKHCFIASQVVGPRGKIIGVDMNDEMLELARRSAPTVAKNIGHSNIEFRRGRIQDLRLDVDDDGHTLERGVRTAVCAKTFRILSSEPYADQTIGIERLNPVPESEREEFDCNRTHPRHPRETKGADYRISQKAEDSSC